jgi:predicted dehydrogenase
MTTEPAPFVQAGPGAPGGPALPAPGRALPPSAVDRGRVEDGRVGFPNWRGEADRPEPPPPAPMPPDRRVGFAVMGLGRLTLGQILPAFAQCRAARPVALVSGDREKAAVVAAQYGIAPDAVYGYDEVARLRDNPAVQAVYVVTPNGLHRDHVRDVAAAGKHVLCEKPMASTSDEARAMVADCEAAGVLLMVAYRCQYETFNRTAIRMVRSGEYGRPRLIEATNTQVQGTADQWRMKGPLAGGGALPDIGLYCLNSARAVIGEEPVEVFARVVNPAGDPRYAEIEETVAFMLRFPSGAIANCAASYGAHESKDMRIRLERGWLDLENAFAYGGQRLRVARRSGEREAVDEIRLQPGNQFALEIDHMAECVLTGRRPRTPGEEGVQDHVIMEALYRSAREGGPVALPERPGLDLFRGPEVA